MWKNITIQNHLNLIMDFNKGRNKMTELETLMLDVTNTLNHKGFDYV